MIYLGVALLSWFIAQVTKYLIYSAKHKTLRNTRPLHDSGRMPSAHSAITVGLAGIIGLEYGINSALFAIAAVLAFIVIYDAMKVRRVVGEQGTFLQKIATNIMLKNAKLPKVAEGHTPLEVLVGSLIGLVVAFLTYFISS